MRFLLSVCLCTTQRKLRTDLIIFSGSMAIDFDLSTPHPVGRGRMGLTYLYNYSPIMIEKKQ